MSNALVERRYQTHPRRVYWHADYGRCLTGAVWSASYIYAPPVYAGHHAVHVFAADRDDHGLFAGFFVAIREYFIVYVFASLWPIAWWSLVHYWEQSYNC